MTEHEITHMLSAYIECALWSSLTEGTDDAEFLDQTDYQLSDDARAEMLADCQAFYEANANDLADMDAEQAGHDFWLTRNHHGTGFWDRGLGALGQRLTDACQPYGDCDLYVGDDQLIHID